MAFEQSDLDNLDKVIAAGVQQVTHADGRSVRYQPTAENLAARDKIADAVASAAPRGPRRRLTVLRVGRR